MVMRRFTAGLGAILFVGVACLRASAQEVPEEVRKQVADSVGGPFVVFRAKVQDDLQLSDEQKEKLDQDLRERLPGLMEFFQKLPDVKPAEREKELDAYRRKVRPELAAVLKKVLKEDQRKRLRQIELQQEGPFTLGGEVGKELKITDQQRKQFMAVVQDLQKKVEPLIKESQSGGKPEEIYPKIVKIRKEHEARAEALLTDAQRKQWKEMLGKPLDLED
jgi:hypothetical protein